MSVRGSALRWSATKWRVYRVIALTCLACCAIAQATAQPVVEGKSDFSFAVTGTAIGDNDRGTRTVLRAIDDSAARFIVHFNLSQPSGASCSAAAIDRRREALERNPKPIVPVVSASEWSTCGGPATDPEERLARVGDAFYSSDESLGQSRLHWSRQSSVPRFHRYRENLRWQAGNALFVVFNLPDNNNNFRFGAGRNGEFEERLVANRVWLERAFRFAAERHLAGIVIFVDAAPRFGTPMRAPDLRGRERDGYYEWKVALRDLTSTFRGQVLLVQGHVVPLTPPLEEPDHPLRDATGKTLTHFTRVALPDVAAGSTWVRIGVDPKGPKLFRIATEHVFDDPSGELYGPARVK
ncbi:MAG: hypothetical protein ACR2GP_07080 [Burkholderiaceae bacterium]